MLSIDEIRNITFRKSVKGYNPDDVNIFIDDVINTIEQIKKEKNSLIGKMDFLAKRVEQYREEEETVKNALIASHKMAEVTVADARKAAEDIIKEAERKADKLIAEANLITSQQKEHYNNIQKDTLVLRDEVLAIYKRHLEVIRELPTESDVDKVKEEIERRYPTIELQSAQQEEDRGSDKKADSDKKGKGKKSESNVEQTDISSTNEDFSGTTTKRTSVKFEDEETENMKEDKKNSKGSSKRDKFANLKFGDNYDIVG